MIRHETGIEFDFGCLICVTKTFYLLKAKDEDKEMEEDKVTIVGRKLM